MEFNGEYMAGIEALVVIALFYLAAGATRYGDQSQGYWLNPLVITAGVFGRASLSNLQVFYFSLIVFWVLAYYLFRFGELSNFSVDVLYLLGIGAAGTAGSKIVTVTRKRLSFVNWAWLKRKKWIKKDIERPSRPPEWNDLLTSEDAFDVNKFQTLFVSFAVGVALFVAAWKGADAAAIAKVSGTTIEGLSKFTIPTSLLGLLGLSQAIHVGGKAIGPSPNAELNTQLNTVRDLESKFIAAVAGTWGTNPPSPADLDAAKNVARVEYNAYLQAAENAAILVQERIGASAPTTHLAPDIPSV